MKNPPYLIYSKRVFGVFKPIVVLIIICVAIFGLIKGGVLLWICNIYSGILFIALLVNSLIVNKFYLKDINLNSDKSVVRIVIVRYDKECIEKEYNIDSIAVKIVENVGVYKTYSLLIKSKKEKVISQKTVGNWNVELFTKIVTTINEAQGKKTYLNYVRKRD